jgi:hypothetical protein
VSATLTELVERLAWSEAGARRVAILDLIRLSENDPEATGVLLQHLTRERDERAGILIVRHLGVAAGLGALPALWALYQDRATPVVLAHAAILAHDTIEARMPERP